MHEGTAALAAGWGAGARRCMTVHARAKLNLCLEVTGRRPDGYHNLATVFAALTLHDTLRVCVWEVSEGAKGALTSGFGAASAGVGPRWAGAAPWGRESRIVVGCEGWAVPGGAANLCYRAAAALLSRVARRPDLVEVTVVKRIPVGGGLGGGSSDAAATILALQRLIGADGEAAREAAEATGSDVAFFLLSSPAALGRGRGEILQPLPRRQGLHVVLAWPGQAVATEWAYSVLAEAQFTDGARAEELAAAMRAGERLDGHPALGWNVFAEAVMSRRVDIARLAKRMRELGATVVSLAGSGACVWGAFEGRGAARRAAEALAEEGIWARWCRLAGRPLVVADPPHWSVEHLAERNCGD